MHILEEATRTIINTTKFLTSVGNKGAENEDLIYMYCTDSSGYCLSLARFPEDHLIEIMAKDQIVHKTNELSVQLSPIELRVVLSPTAVAELDGISEYIVPLTIPEGELRELAATLSLIFEGGRGSLNLDLP